MSELLALLERADRAVADVPLPTGDIEMLERRREQKQRNRRIRAGVVAIIIAALGAAALARSFSFASVPADDPDVQGSNVFSAFAGRIYADNTFDGFGPAWVDPDGPVDTKPGPSVSSDVSASALPGEFGGTVTGWSADGLQLLLLRSDGGLLPDTTLSILHADGTETPLMRKPIFQILEATLSPDGSRVLFRGQGELLDNRVYTLDAQGRPIRFPIPDGGPDLGLPTFSPDGSRIAFVAGGRDPGVWLANADGSGAHRILMDAPVSFGDVTGIAWSPAGDLIAIGVGTHEQSDSSIYTFAPDGSGFRKVIDLGSAPSWSPDGSRIAYTIWCDPDPNYSCRWFDQEAHSPGLAIADADGSHVKEFGYGGSGPWYPDAQSGTTS
jgi:hypothetical protein